MEFYKSPICANFIITRNCNSNCIFCGVEHKSLKKCRDEDISKIKNIIDILNKNEILRINFFGGEPLVYPKIIEAIKYSKELGFFNSLITNGFNINEKLCSEFVNNLDCIGVSLHGLKKHHEELTRVPNSFDIVLSKLEILNRFNIPININMTVTKKNYLDIPEFVDLLLSKYKIEGFAFNRCIPNKYNSNEINEELVPTITELTKSLYLIKEVDEKYPNVNFSYAIHFPYCVVKDKSLLKYVGSCGFGKNYISIDQDGYLQLCSYTDKVLGNIFEDNFSDIWEKHRKIKEYRSEKWMPQKCLSCTYKMKCMAGCKVSSGIDFFAPDILLKKDVL